MISLERRHAILDGFRDKRMLVVGDMMLDRYVSGKVTRISPEAPVPVVHVETERCMPGGAANVALNVQSMGGEAIVCGLVGTDRSGLDLTTVLQQNSISTDALLAHEGLQTTVKTRLMADRQQIARIDYEDRDGIAADVVQDLCARIRASAGEVDGIIIEDYAKGVVSQAVVDTVLEAGSANDVIVGFDPNFNQQLEIKGVTLATPNYAEAIAAAGLTSVPTAYEGHSEALLAEAGQVLSARWHPDLMIITLGPRGMYLHSHDGQVRTIPTLAREVYDVSGAGDTVIATAMLALLGGASHDEAAELANLAAGIVVGRIGAATCTVEDLVADEWRAAQHTRPEQD